jgi:hypothetical protein
MSALLLGIAGAPAAQAGVVYNFSGGLAIFSGSVLFQYTASTFITSDTAIPAAGFDFCNASLFVHPASCALVNFFPLGPDSPSQDPEIKVLLLQSGSPATLFYYFAPGSDFATPGTMSTPSGNPATLTITAAAAVPEPATWLGVLPAVLGLGVRFRRRRRSR